MVWESITETLKTLSPACKMNLQFIIISMMSHTTGSHRIVFNHLAISHTCHAVSYADRSTRTSPTFLPFLKASSISYQRLSHNNCPLFRLASVDNGVPKIQSFTGILDSRIHPSISIVSDCFHCYFISSEANRRFAWVKTEHQFHGVS